MKFLAARRARLLLLPVSETSGALAALAALAAALDSDAADLGVPREERAFVPHVTLGRFRAPTDATRLLGAAPALHLSARLATLTLYESVTAPEGARYTALVGADLAGG